MGEQFRVSLGGHAVEGQSVASVADPLTTSDQEKT